MGAPSFPHLLRSSLLGFSTLFTKVLSAETAPSWIFEYEFEDCELPIVTLSGFCV